MKQKTIWEASDGEVFDVRAECAAYERAVRTSAKSDYEFRFTVICDGSKPPKFPAGLWIDGDYAYVRFTTAARDDATAIGRAVQRCWRLREMTRTYWKIDREMKRDGKEVDIGGDLLLNDLELV